MDYEKLWNDLKLELTFEASNGVTAIHPVTLRSLMEAEERIMAQGPVSISSYAVVEEDYAVVKEDMEASAAEVCHG